VKRIAIAIALLFLLAGGARAQTITTVTGTVLDPTGIPFANAPVNIVLTGGPGSPTPIVTATNSPVEMPVAPTTNAAGQFTVNLVANGSISAAGSTYAFRACSLGVAPPVGNGNGGCVAISGVTIAGASQDLSALFAAVPPPPLINLTNPSRVYNVIPAAGTASLPTTTMVIAPAQPATGTHYAVAFYLTQTALGASCAANSTVLVNVIYQDPNAAAPSTLAYTTFLILGNGVLGGVLNFSGAVNAISQWGILAKPGTPVQYSTTYTPGTSCAPAPAVQLFPVLEIQ
jgi:hypothetical protein